MLMALTNVSFQLGEKVKFMLVVGELLHVSLFVS